MTANGNRLIRYSIGRGNNLGKVENKAEPYSVFKDRFRRPTRTAETMRAYLKMSDVEQKNLKAVDGFFFRSQVTRNEEGKFQRTRGSGLPSDVLTFDFDYPSVEYFERAKRGELLPGIEHFIQTSRRHTAEKPRFRLIVPVYAPVSNDLYPAVSRIIAREMDPKMEFVDPVSFRPAQMMFFPTLCSDSEFVFEEFEGSILNYQTALDQFEMLEGDWRDITILPRTVGEGQLRESQEKAENPLTKAGIVGTFCRAYSVPDAIAEFLPGVYTPVDLPSRKPRYTYALGTTVNGAEVQDEGLFLYSHHGSDPCSDQLVNAFDLVRIHLYGKQDKDFDAENKKVTDRPSFKSMLEFVKTDPGYRKQLVNENYDLEAMLDGLVDEDRDGVDLATIHAEADDLLGTPSEAAPLHVEVNSAGEAALTEARPRRPMPAKGPDGKPLWIQDLEMNQFGGIVPNLANVSKIVNNDLRFRDAVAYNEFDQKVVLIQPLRSKHEWLPSFSVANPLRGEPLQDHHLGAIRSVMEEQNGPGKLGWGMKVADRDLTVAVTNLARINTFNPVCDALNSFKWDGKKRLDRLFVDYLGCPNDAYHRETARMFCLAAVARAFEPGHKFDYMPVLVGTQGVRKTTFIKTLALHWAGSLTADFSDDKKLVEQMAGCWIMEQGELVGMVRSEIEPMKQFITATETTVRAAYGRLPTVYPRRTVFMGSTNREDFLKDPTGNRRFWVILVKVEKIDTGRLQREIAQIWAEAVHEFRAMRALQPKGDLPLYLRSDETQAAALAHQSDAMQITEGDVIADTIRPYLDRKVPLGDDPREERMVHRTVTAVSEIKGAFQGSGSSQWTAERIANAIRACGWRNAKRERIGGSKNPMTTFRPGPDLIAAWKAADEDPESLL